MNAPPNVMAYSRYLSHVEIVYPPGGQDLAKTFLGVLGIDAREGLGGRFMVSIVEAETYVPGHFANFMGGSQAREEQWEFEQALKEAITTGPLAEKFAKYQDRLDREPTSGMHVGFHYSTVEAWEAAVERLKNVLDDYPELEGRFRITSITRPGDADSIAPLYQAFIWTDVLSAGALAFGQRFELSAINPADIE